MDLIEQKMLEEKLSDELYFAYKNKDKKILFVVSSDEILSDLKRNPNFPLTKFSHVTFVSAYSIGTIESDMLNNLNFDWLIIDDFLNLIYTGKVLLNLDVILERNPNLKIYKLSRGSIHEDAVKEYKNLREIQDKDNLEDVANLNRRTMEMDWDKMYDLVLTYYNFHHTLKMPKNFKTINGYSSSNDRNALNLELWLTLQLTLLRNDKLLFYQRKKLEALNDLDKESKLMASKKRICMQYNINYEINRDIIDNTSEELLIAKINFLKSNGLPIMNLSGRLHQIFEEEILDFSKHEI